MRVRTRGLVASLLLSCAAAGLAAQQPRPAPSGPGMVRGVVYDSLIRSPLEGARVWIRGTMLSAVTDGGGRFRLDSVPVGRHVILFEHDDLDSAGLTNNARRIDVAAGRPTVVELNVPSLATLRRSACATRVNPLDADSGMIFGSVSDAESGARLSGARVSVFWTTAGRGPDGRIAVGRPLLEVTTDSIGNYYHCGVPTEFIVNVAAQAGRFRSGLTELLLGRRGVARRDISISRDAALLAEDTATGERSGRATIIGLVTDENDTPRPSARASVDDASSGENFADEQGRFILSNLPAGSQTLMVRMIGYTAIRLPVALRNGDTTRVRVRMRSLTVLDTIQITATNPLNRILLDELEQRRRAGTGYFLSAEEAKRRPSMRAVFEGLPGMLIQGRSTFQFTMFTGRASISGALAPVIIFVDGHRETPDAIQSYRPEQIIGVEWFPRGVDAPMRYQSFTTESAGVLLIWTRFVR